MTLIKPSDPGYDHSMFTWNSAAELHARLANAKTTILFLDKIAKDTEAARTNSEAIRRAQFKQLASAMAGSRNWRAAHATLTESYRSATFWRDAFAAAWIVTSLAFLFT